jgi:hypothetical protein
MSSGAITWVEFRGNPKVDTERGEWTKKISFHSVVFAGTFIVAILY